LKLLEGVNFRGSFEFSSLRFSYSFLRLCRFSCFLLALQFFLLFLGFFDLLAMLHEVLNSNFKLCAFVINGLIKGKIEKSSGQSLGLIVMSHCLGEV
jgi:hypothetical protein